MKQSYNRTFVASCMAFVCQAIVVNLAPLLFVTFQKEFDISVGKIGFLVTYNFLIQLTVDILASRFADRIGYRKCVIAAHVFCVIGLIGLGQFPYWFSDPYIGLLVATTIYAAAGGLIEVLISPIVEALPMKNKSAAMSLSHGFYAWGYAVVVILSTVYLVLAGMVRWRLLTALWAVVPVVNVLLFANAPILTLPADDTPEKSEGIFRQKTLWFFALLILCGGASEQAMGQWASYFAETGLKVNKATGDLLGPCLFAALMGLSRVGYGFFGEKIPLEKCLFVSGSLCSASYLLTVFSPYPILSLIGCACCGLFAGIMWPGMVSVSAKAFPKGGTAMFALLAVAGDMGCALGPSVVSAVSGFFENQLKAGLLAAVCFPILFGLGLWFVMKKLSHK